MIQETVLAVDATGITTESGGKTCIGNRRFEVGESVWTDGPYALGNERRSSAPVIFGGSMVKATGDYFVWIGATGTDKHLTYRLYDAKTLSYVEVPVKIDGFNLTGYGSTEDDYTLPGFCYNAAGTVFGFLLFNSDYTGYSVRVLKADGWYKYEIPYGGGNGRNYSNADCYIDDNGDMRIRLFYESQADRAFNMTTQVYRDINYGDVCFEYYTNGTLTKTSTVLSSAQQTAMLTKMLSESDAIIAADDRITLTAKMAYTGTVVDLSDTYASLDRVKRVSNADAESICENYSERYSNTSTRKELDDRKASSVVYIGLTCWQNERIWYNATSNVPVWMAWKDMWYDGGAHPIEYKTFNTYYGDRRGNTAAYLAFMLASLDITDWAYLANGAKTTFMYKKKYGNGDGKSSATPDPSGWVGCSGTEAQAYIVANSGTEESTGLGGTSRNKYIMLHDTKIDADDVFDESASDYNITLEDGFTVSFTGDAVVIDDGKGWTLDTHAAGSGVSTTQPCLTVISDDRFILDYYVYKKSDKSFKAIDTGFNCRMPLIRGTTQDALKAMLSQ